MKLNKYKITFTILQKYETEVEADCPDNAEYVALAKWDNYVLKPIEQQINKPIVEKLK